MLLSDMVLYNVANPRNQLLLVLNVLLLCQGVIWANMDQNKYNVNENIHNILI